MMDSSRVPFDPERFEAEFIKLSVDGMTKTVKRLRRDKVEKDHLIDDDSDFDQWSKEERDQMDEKFFEFLLKTAGRTLVWEAGKKSINFDDDLKEEEYWILRFKKEYQGLIDRRANRNSWLVAYLHAFIYYVTDKKLLWSDEYPDKDGYCAPYLTEIEIICR